MDVNEKNILSLKDDIEIFHNFGVSVLTRTIYFGSLEYNESLSENGIDWKVAEQVIKNLHILSTSSKAKINIISYSCGGDFSASIAIHDAIKRLPNKVIMTAYGCCMSGASIVMQAADVRQMSSNSRFMIHDGYVAFEGKNNDFKLSHKENEINEDIMHQIYFNRIKDSDGPLTLKMLKEKCKDDWFMSAEEALEYGFIDKVI